MMMISARGSLSYLKATLAFQLHFPFSGENCKRQTANCKVHFALAAIAERASNWFCIAQIALQLSQLLPKSNYPCFFSPSLSLSRLPKLPSIWFGLVWLGARFFGLNGLSVLSFSLTPSRYLPSLVIFRFDSGQRAKLPVDFGFGFQFCSLLHFLCTLCIAIDQ